ncbi:hypothetical protein AB5I41_14785 [Sphingomonas sp. MMS24-JH45]
MPTNPYVNDPSRRPDAIAVNNQQYQIINTYAHALTLTARSVAVTVKSITAHRRFTYFDNAPDKDVDGSPLALAGGGFNTRYKAFSQELQASGTAVNGRLTYVGGVFDFDDDGSTRNPTYFWRQRVRHPPERPDAIDRGLWSGGFCDYRYADGHGRSALHA